MQKLILSLWFLFLLNCSSSGTNHRPELNDLNSVKTSNKSDDEFRTYEPLLSPERVVEHYRDMRQFQTLEFYKRMEKKYDFSNGQFRSLMTIEEAFEELENYVDASDPDLALPNLLHLLQTAEGIRRANLPDWMQLTGLLHDMGKIMFLWGTEEDGQDGTSSNSKQWALGGDTFVLGCKIPDDAVVFPEFNKLNPDMSHPVYQTKFGIYKPNCGIDQLKWAWGHDEYMYRMLVANKTTLPQEALDMIRFHSAYPMHEKGAYRYFFASGDEERIEWVKLFNRFDLYTKDEEYDLRDKLDDLMPYYRSLMAKYSLSGKLKW